MSIHLYISFYCRYHHGAFIMWDKRRWHKLRRLDVLFERRWYTARTRNRRLIIYVRGKKKQIRVSRGRVTVFIPAHYEPVRKKPKPKPVRRTRRRRRYGRRGLRRRRRWRRRLRRRRRRRRRRYIRRRRRAILLFRFHGRWRAIVKWRGAYAMRYKMRWIYFR